MYSQYTLTFAQLRFITNVIWETMKALLNYQRLLSLQMASVDRSACGLDRKFANQ